MRSILGLVLLAIATQPARSATRWLELAPAKHSGMTEEWARFKSVYNRQYSDSEEMKRRDIFLANAKLIATHNKRFEQGQETYGMEMNQFGDQTLEEFSKARGLLNFQATKPPALHSLESVVLPETEAPPSSVNWVDRGAVTPVGNELQCGACWAFSSIESLEGAYFIKEKKLVALSEQQLIDCSSKFGNHGCEGGLFTTSYDYIKKHGIERASDYPYVGKDEQCHSNASLTAVRVKDYASGPKGDEAALQAAVYSKGPVAAACYAQTQGFMFYKSGVYKDSKCSNKLGDHSVTVVGYGQENGQDYWLCKNNWGVMWGDKGYIKIARNANNMCGIANIYTWPIL